MLTDDWLYMTRGITNVTDDYVDYTAGRLTIHGSGTAITTTHSNTSKMVDNGFCSGMVQTSQGGIMGAGGHASVSATSKLLAPAEMCGLTPCN
jgi:hypothetical protein